MKIFDIELRRPGFGDFTSAAAIATGFWALLQLSPIGAHSARGAGSLLVLSLVGCLSLRCGVDVSRGPRHAVLAALAGLAGLATYELALLLSSPLIG